MASDAVKKSRRAFRSRVKKTFDIVDRALGFKPGTVDPDWSLTGKPLFMTTEGLFDFRDDVNVRLKEADLRQAVTVTEMNKSSIVGDVYRAALT